MSKTKTLSKGFKANKNQLTYEVKVEIFRLGFYITLIDNGSIINTMHRVKLKKAQEAIDEQKRKIEKKGYIIKELGEHKVKFNEKDLTYSVQL